MKKEALKELGKLFYDIGKIVFAVAVIAPFIKKEVFSIGICYKFKFMIYWNRAY